MGKFTFSGAEKRIYVGSSIVEGTTASFTPQELWTEWVQWVSLSDNSKYLPAFESVMIELDATTLLGQYLFIRNDLGWRIIPPEVSGVNIIINGSFYAKDSNIIIMDNIDNQETGLIINRSTLTSTVAVGSGGTTDLSSVLTKLNEIQNSLNSSSALTIEQHNKLMSTATKQDVYNAVLM